MVSAIFFPPLGPKRLLLRSMSVSEARPSVGALGDADAAGLRGLEAVSAVAEPTHAVQAAARSGWPAVVVVAPSAQKKVRRRGRARDCCAGPLIAFPVAWMVGFVVRCHCERPLACASRFLLALALTLTRPSCRHARPSLQQ